MRLPAHPATRNINQNKRRQNHQMLAGDGKDVDDACFYVLFPNPLFVMVEPSPKACRGNA